MPLQFDMPYEELLIYGGSSPKPDDFDAFWDRSLEELAEVDPDISIEPSSFSAPHAECFDLIFTGTGGSRVYSKLLRPKGAGISERPAFIEFHGYGGSSQDWFNYLGWVGAGYTVAAMDCRGQGGMSEDRGCVSGTTRVGHIVRGIEDDPENMLFRNVFLDTARLTQIVSALPYVNSKRVSVGGGSQGGGLALACAALVPDLIYKTASTFPFLSDFKRIWEMDKAVDAYDEIREYFRRRDPLHQHVDLFWEKLGYIDIQNLAPRIKSKLLMVVGLMDTICPPSTQFAAYNKISSEKELLVYKDYGHENMPQRLDKVFEFIDS